MLTKYSKNDEIQQVFSDLSKPVVYTTQITKNSEYTSLYIAQSRIMGDPNNLDSLLLGWNTRILRTVRNARTDIVQRMNIQPGYVFKDCNIRIHEKTEPTYFGQLPKVNPSTGSVITYQNKPVYEATELTFGESKDSLLDRNYIDSGLRKKDYSHIIEVVEED